jgi:hypothetical protein
MEENTYFCYAEGIDSQFLRLGSLAFDYANPRSQAPYIHTYSRNLLEEPALASADQRPVCYLAYERGRSNSFGAGIQQLLTFDTSRTGSSCSLVVGKDGSKFELVK